MVMNDDATGSVLCHELLLNFFKIKVDNDNLNLIKL